MSGKHLKSISTNCHIQAVSMFWKSYRSCWSKLKSIYVCLLTKIMCLAHLELLLVYVMQTISQLLKKNIQHSWENVWGLFFFFLRKTTFLRESRAGTSKKNWKKQSVCSLFLMLYNPQDTLYSTIPSHIQQKRGQRKVVDIENEDFSASLARREDSSYPVRALIREGRMKPVKKQRLAFHLGEEAFPAASATPGSSITHLNCPTLSADSKWRPEPRGS